MYAMLGLGLPPWTISFVWAGAGAAPSARKTVARSSRRPSARGDMPPPVVCGAGPGSERRCLITCRSATAVRGRRDAPLPVPAKVRVEEEPGEPAGEPDYNAPGCGILASRPLAVKREDGPEGLSRTT